MRVYQKIFGSINRAEAFFEKFYQFQSNILHIIEGLATFSEFSVKDSKMSQSEIYTPLLLIDGCRSVKKANRCDVASRPDFFSSQHSC